MFVVFKLQALGVQLLKDEISCNDEPWNRKDEKPFIHFIFLIEYFWKSELYVRQYQLCIRALYTRFLLYEEGIPSRYAIILSPFLSFYHTVYFSFSILLSSFCFLSLHLPLLLPLPLSLSSPPLSGVFHPEQVTLYPRSTERKTTNINRIEARRRRRKRKQIVSRALTLRKRQLKGWRTNLKELKIPPEIFNVPSYSWGENRRAKARSVFSKLNISQTEKSWFF